MTSEPRLLREADRKKKARRRRRGPYRKSYNLNVKPAQNRK